MHMHAQCACMCNIAREPNIKHVNYFISISTICFKNLQCNIYVLFSLQTHNRSSEFNSLHHWTKSYAQKFGSAKKL